MDIKQIPKHVGKQFLAGLKKGDLVQVSHASYSQTKNFEIKGLPAGSVGRVKRIYDFGARAAAGKRSSSESRFLIYCKFEGHPLTNFYAEELQKVKV